MYRLTWTHTWSERGAHTHIHRPMYVHTYTYTCTYTCTCKLYTIHTESHTDLCGHTKHVHRKIHTYTYTCVWAHTHTLVYTPVHTPHKPHPHKCTYTQLHIYAIHTEAHTHIPHWANTYVKHTHMESIEHFTCNAAMGYWTPVTRTPHYT